MQPVPGCDPRHRRESGCNPLAYFAGLRELRRPFLLQTARGSVRSFFVRELWPAEPDLRFEAVRSGASLCAAVPIALRAATPLRPTMGACLEATRTTAESQASKARGRAFESRSSPPVP